MKVVFFKTKKPDSFTYKPRYFDPEKEAVEERKKARERRLSGNGDSLRDEMSRKWHRKTKQKSNRLTIIYIALLIMLLLYLFGR